MEITAGTIETDAGTLPLLITEMASQLLGVSAPGGELTNLLVSALLRESFTLLTDLSQLPESVDGWTVTVTAGVGGAEPMLEITDRSGTCFFTGTAALPPDWLAAADRNGWCLLYAGECGIGQVGPGADPAGPIAALDAAAHNGALVGARIAVTRRAA